MGNPTSTSAHFLSHIAVLIRAEGRLDDEAERIAAMPREAMLKAGLECVDLDDFLRCLHSAQ